jgi:CheY-like chemotaxis protein
MNDRTTFGQTADRTAAGGLHDAAAPPPPAGTARKTVLVADDEPGIRALFSAVLGKDPRCRLLTAGDGQEALDLIQQERPDLVFLDIVLPRRNGWEVCETVRRDTDVAQTKIILVSALGQDSHRRKAWQIGADGYVTKPFTIASLTRLMDELFLAP